MLPRQTHAVAPKESLDRFVFIVAFLVGVVGSVVLKVYDLHPFVVAGFAATVLVGYAFLSWAGGRVRIEPEVIGDNCYYLGFLFTLASLAYTLYQMADPTINGGRPVDIPDVISGFGVALSSTIAGVFLRVLMMQMRPDFVAREREVRADVNRSFLDFRKGMSGMLSQMKAYSTESVQLASERDERIRMSTEMFFKDHMEELTKSTKALSEAMERAFSEAAQNAIADISKSILENNQAQQKQMQEFLKELQKLKEQMNNQEVESIEAMLERRMRLVSGMETAEKTMQEHDAAMGQYIKVTRRAADAMTKRMAPALDAFLERLEKMPSTEPVQDDSIHTGEESQSDLEEVAERPITVRPTRPGPWAGRSRRSE